MKKITITNDNFKPYQLDINGLEIILVDKSNLLDLESKIQFLINQFNQRYKWDNMFNIIEVARRISDSQKMYLLFYNNSEIGYVWIKENTKDVCYAYNLFVSKYIDRPIDSPKWLLSKVYGNQLLKYKQIEMEIEDWHTTTFNIVYSLMNDKG